MADSDHEGMSLLFVGHTTKLSSAGLVYKHYGKEILKDVVFPLELSGDDVQMLYLKVYKGFIEAIDGIDNGIDICQTDCPHRYIDSTGLSSRVGRLNPAWNESDPTIVSDNQFHKAMELCGKDFSDFVTGVAKSWIPARIHVIQALEERMDIHPSGHIMLLRQFCPWKEHLLELEKERDMVDVIKFCIYQDQKGGYRVQAVPVALDSFESRLPLPMPWRALRGTELDGVSGIDGCVFVHASGFIGGHQTQEGALEMASRALSLKPDGQ